ncbi:MAG TPA: hypothetical protein VJ859_14570 [Allosphingosinicella sp.]|nr:hypothetical protein [Allosphingosinicella sp.]
MARRKPPLSFGLARAVNAGRADNARPTSREQVLSRLLTKRAAAHRAGLRKLEEALRCQIAWALPVRDGEDPASAVPKAFSSRLAPADDS